MKRRVHRRGCAAFTLFEMIVVIMIFVLMAGGIYATVSAAVQASATLSEENLRSQRLNAFAGLLRRTFHNLPATAKISGGVRADGEGIPTELWQKLLALAEDYAPDRILAAIDVFADTEGRMKWATNKRLHFELGVIKAIQVLAEVRITDVIKVLTKGADFCGAPPPAPAATAAPASDAGESATALPPVAAPAPPPPKPKPTASGFAALESMIEEAPEVSEAPPEPESPPWNEEPKSVAAPPPPPPQPAADENFYQDPLIDAALEKFKGKVVSG